MRLEMVIKVLGTGCTNCKTLESRAIEAVNELQLDAVVEKVTDIQQIVSYGVMRTPALVVDEKVVLYGRVPSVSEIKDLLSK